MDNIYFMDNNTRIRKFLTYKSYIYSKYICIPKDFEKLNLEENQLMKLMLNENNQLIVTRLEI